jgi:hypothetical protein
MQTVKPAGARAFSSASSLSRRSSSASAELGSKAGILCGRHRQLFLQLDDLGRELLVCSHSPVVVCMVHGGVVLLPISFIFRRDQLGPQILALQIGPKAGPRDSTNKQFGEPRYLSYDSDTL